MPAKSGITGRNGQSDSDHMLPVRVDRKRGAKLVTDRFFPVSSRTLEVWPLPWRHVNGKALCEVADLFAFAQAKLDAAASTQGGQGTAIATT